MPTATNSTPRIRNPPAAKAATEKAAMASPMLLRMSTRVISAQPACGQLVAQFVMRIRYATPRMYPARRRHDTERPRGLVCFRSRRSIWKANVMPATNTASA